jgi:hypothetical protein
MRDAEVAELVDALDLGSSGAIRGGSSPPFRMLQRARVAKQYTTCENARRLLSRVDETENYYEKKKRNPGFFEKKEGFATAQRSR